MKLNIALCDDDEDALPIISGAVKSTFRAQNIPVELHIFSSGQDLLTAMEEQQFNLLLLDIEMTGMDGITVARRIRKQEQPVEIVFVSECEDRVFESFLVHPFGFVRKSNFLNDIRAVVQLYLELHDRKRCKNYVELLTRTGPKNFEIRDIRFIEGCRNYQLLYLTGQDSSIELKMTMERLETILEPFGFIRIHKGYLVNYLQIERIQATELSLQNGQTLPIGRSKQSDVKARYISLLGD